MSIRAGTAAPNAVFTTDLTSVRHGSGTTLSVSVPVLLVVFGSVQPVGTVAVAALVTVPKLAVTLAVTVIS